MLATVRRFMLPATLAVAAFATPAAPQQPVTSPEAFFGHEIGADYVLPGYRQMAEYWRLLDAESDRMKRVEIGKTAEGRPQYMAIVTSPANHRDLERYRSISERLARARVDEAEARRLAADGRAVVWIDGGLHATEVLGAQQLMATVHHLVSRDDPETLRILDDVIVLAVHANPDGHDLVADWYMREPVPERRSTAGVPRLYQKYVGHDNNRDFYASTQVETENINRQLYHVWYPQILYNHHQTGPTGTVMFAPPFRDPFNYVFDPLIVTGIDVVGAAMHNRFIAEAKPGVTMRRGANYSTWWNGGLRTTVYFHNMIGLLTETIGNPTPMDIPFLPARQIPSADLPSPIEPQRWHFRSSVDYSVTANLAVLDVASRNRDAFLFNIWRMGRNSIERGSRDSWTPYPGRVEAVQAAMEAERGNGDGPSGVMSVGGFARNPPSPGESRRYLEMLRDPELRDARGYVIPADQADFPTAVKFVNALRETGIEVHRALEPFSAGGRRYPAGSLVVRADQAFRPHVLDMFEPQDHPNDFLYAGGPPIPPYDAAGWTFAFLMGIEFDRLLDDFDGPFVEVTDWNLAPPAGTVEPRPAAGYLLSPRYTDGFAAVQRLLRQGERVFRVTEAWRAGDREHAAGTFYIPAGRSTRARLEAVARELGLSFQAAVSAPAGEHLRLSRPRIALWDRYGGSMPSGWTRWILEQNGADFEVVYPRQLDADDLRDRYDVIVLVDGAVPGPGGRGGWRGAGLDTTRIPAELRHRLGTITPDRTVPRLRRFLERGGSIVTIGSSTQLAEQLGLPVGSHLVDDSGTPHPRERFFIPGSVLQVRVDPTRPVAFGLDERLDVFFAHSPVLALRPGAAEQGVRSVAHFDSPEPLRSGWAWGQHLLEGGSAVVEAPVGRGTLYLFGPEILYRAQPHGNFKLFFNALLHAAAREQRIR